MVVDWMTTRDLGDQLLNQNSLVVSCMAYVATNKQPNPFPLSLCIYKHYIFSLLWQFRMT